MRDDLFESRLFYFFGSLCRCHPAPFAFVGFGPFAVNVAYLDRVDQRKDRNCVGFTLLHVAVDAKADVIGFAGQARFFPGFGCGGLCRCLVMHWPALRQDPAFCFATGDQTDLHLFVAHAVTQGCELCAHLRFLNPAELQRELCTLARLTL